MKKYVFYVAILSLALFSCSKNESNQPAPESNVILEEPKSEIAEAATTTASPEEEGKTLVEGADCLSCHKVDVKLVGPSYQEVAAKYSEADVELLAQKIIDGSKGVWGDIPMTPHAGLSKENAQKMVKYILSLKK